MKSRKTAVVRAFTMPLLSLSTVVCLFSCSKQARKMEGQSATWKVTVISVTKLPKRPDKDERNYPSANGQSDLLEIAFTAELLGAGGKIAIPKPVLLDGKGQKHASVQSSQELPERISKMPEGREKRDEISKLLACLSQESEGREPCPIATGEKLSLTSSFIDLKDTNLKFSFADVPPIVLKVPEK